MTDQEILAFADHFIAVLEAGDVEAVRACYAPDAKIWHNFDDVEQSVEQNLKSMQWIMRRLPRRHYRIVRREALSDGFLQQHVLEADLPDGSLWKLAACVVIRMQDGLITRLDEYLDSAPTAVLQTIGR